MLLVNLISIFLDLNFTKSNPYLYYSIYSLIDKKLNILLIKSFIIEIKSATLFYESFNYSINNNFKYYFVFNR